MTEKEFKNAFERTGWEVVYENDKKRALVRLKSGQTEIIAGATWLGVDTNGEDLREMTFRNAVLDLGGRLRPDSRSWTFPAWFIGGKAVESPGWCMDPDTRRPRVGSVEEFVFKLSAFDGV